MSERAYKTIVILISLALFFVIGLQLLWLMNLLEVRKAELREKTNLALNQLAHQLQKEEQVELVTRNFGGGLGDSSFVSRVQKIVKVAGTAEKEKQHRQQELVFIDTATVQLNGLSTQTSRTIIKLNPGRTGQTIIVNTETKKRRENREKDFHQIIDQLVKETDNRDVPILNRFSFDSLKFKLSNILSTYGIDQSFEYAVVAEKDKVLKATAGYAAANNNLKYKARLYPDDILRSDNQLMLFYTGEYGYAFSRLKPILWLSVFFTLIIIVVFIFTLRTIARQKKLAEVKNDFINNMTHELKTPIATISIAVDALNNPKVRANDEKAEYYRKVIYEEKERLHTQVEKVLQMAMLDKGKLKLSLEPLSLNSLLQEAVQTYQLQLEQQQAKLSWKLNALPDIIAGDKFHLQQAINNILDNAIKYSTAAPEIELLTENKGKEVHVFISDKGMGMDKNTQEKVFEKFYRAQSGNIHEVKGFGLGLSYVKNIVELCGGKVMLKSSKGTGTTVILIFNAYGKQ